MKLTKEEMLEAYLCPDMYSKGYHSLQLNNKVYLSFNGHKSASELGIDKSRQFIVVAEGAHKPKAKLGETLTYVRGCTPCLCYFKNERGEERMSFWGCLSYSDDFTYCHPKENNGYNTVSFNYSREVNKERLEKLKEIFLEKGKPSYEPNRNYNVTFYYVGTLSISINRYNNSISSVNFPAFITDMIIEGGFEEAIRLHGICNFLRNHCAFIGQQGRDTLRILDEAITSEFPMAYYGHNTYIDVFSKEGFIKMIIDYYNIEENNQKLGLHFKIRLTNDNIYIDGLNDDSQEPKNVHSIFGF